MENLTQSPIWYRHFHGEKQVQSGSQGQIVERLQLAPLRGFIALASGNPEGDLFALIELLGKRAKNLPVICQSCSGTIENFSLPSPPKLDARFHFESGHFANCKLFAQAAECINPALAEPFTETILRREIAKLKLQRRETWREGNR